MRRETFCELNRTALPRTFRSSEQEFRRGYAILSAQYDGPWGDPTNMRRLSGAFRFEARRPLTRLCRLEDGADGQPEYTRKTIVETMPYTEVDVPEQQGAEIRTTVRQFEVTEEEAGQRLDNFVHKHLGDIPRSRVYRVIRKGEVRVNGHRAGPDTRLQAHDKIRIPPVRVRPPEEVGRPSAELQERMRQAIIYEDDRLLVLDKPSGIAVHGGSGISFGVIEALRALRPEEHLELAHRLDRDTSGCLIVARSTAALRIVHALLREEDSSFEKRYLTLLQGQWDLGKKRIDAPLRTDTRVSGERTVRVDASGKPSAK